MIRRMIIASGQIEIDRLPSDEVAKADLIAITAPTAERPEGVDVIKSRRGTTGSFVSLGAALAHSGLSL